VVRTGESRTVNYSKRNKRAPKSRRRLIPTAKQKCNN
jgi:hypothetical protein